MLFKVLVAKSRLIDQCLSVRMSAIHSNVKRILLFDDDQSSQNSSSPIWVVMRR